MGGDFNSGILKSPGLVGPAVLPLGGWGDRLTSARELTSFAEEHGLVALNTWSGNSPATFLHKKGHSQIDFLFARQGSGDGVARRCAPQDVPVGGWRDMDHRALDASVRAKTLGSPKPHVHWLVFWWFVSCPHMCVQSC